MRVLTTPDERFTNLPDYPFVPSYLDIASAAQANTPSNSALPSVSKHSASLRMHYIDEGPRDGEIVLMLHGEPSWSYLYRHMIPVFVDAGYRAIAPDLIGFGRSDKPTRRSDYSYEIHVEWMRRFISQLGLKKINLVCQDWGSLIGLRVAAENSDWFARIALGNGGLPTGDATMPKAFKSWQRFAKYSPIFPIAKIIQWGCRTPLSADVLNAYNAPFPSGKYKAAARVFPALVPCQPNDPAANANRAAWKYFEQSHAPFLTAFSNKDPITRGGERMWQEKVPGAKNVEHVTIDGAGHFLQEDCGPEFAQAVINFIHATPLS